MSLWYKQLAALEVMTEADARQCIEEQSFKNEVARIQEGIDRGTVWMNARDGKLAAGFIGSGLCRERR